MVPRLPFRRPPRPSLLRSGMPMMMAAGAGAVASASLRVLWRAVNGGNNADAPDQIAALTAQSVADAARAGVIESVDGVHSPDEGTIASATTRAMRETASAGADVTAAALGAIDGAIIVHRDAGLSRSEAVTAARSAAISTAEEIGTTAAERVRRVLESRGD